MPISILNGVAVNVTMQRKAVADPSAADDHNRNRSPSIQLVNMFGTNHTLSGIVIRLR